MSRSAPSEARVFQLGLAGIAAVTLWRLALLPFDSRDLFVDEAQYWFWGQELAWGYYSKPPLIGWLLRAATEIGSDAPAWIRAPLPLIHAGTAVVVALIGRRLFGARTGAVAGIAFVTLPGVALGSLLVSTDTPLLLAFAVAMLAHLHLAERRSAAWAVGLGAAVGLGLLSKYAMVYFPLSAAVAAAALPAARIAWRDALVAGAVALALVAPNLAWNAANDFATLQHTAYNADWEGPTADLPALAGFWAGQFAVAGPIVFAAYLVGLPRARVSPAPRYPALMSLPVFAIVSVQALLAGANANWAAAGHLGAVLVAAVVLAGRRRWLAAAVAVNLAATVALPVAAVFADRWRVGDALVLDRYVGQAETSRAAAALAREAGIDTVVSSSRTYLADLVYTLRDSGLAVYAVPEPGFPPHHYAQAMPLPPGPGPVLLLQRGSGPPDCPTGAAAPQWLGDAGSSGEASGWAMPRSCWHAPDGGGVGAP